MTSLRALMAAAGVTCALAAATEESPRAQADARIDYLTFAQGAVP